MKLFLTLFMMTGFNGIYLNFNYQANLTGIAFVVRGIKKSESITECEFHAFAQIYIVTHHTYENYTKRYYPPMDSIGE